MDRRRFGTAPCGSTMAKQLTSRAYDLVVHKWRDLAERRRAHFVDLYNSGRWRHYYTEAQFLARMREVVETAETWAKIAPRPTEAERAAARSKVTAAAREEQLRRLQLA